MWKILGLGCFLLLSCTALHVERGFEFREEPVQYTPAQTEFGTVHDLSQQVRGDLQLSLGLLEILESSRFTFTPTAGSPIIRAGLQVSARLALSYTLGLTIEMLIADNERWFRVCAYYGVINQVQKFCQEFDNFEPSVVEGSTQ